MTAKNTETCTYPSGFAQVSCDKPAKWIARVAIGRRKEWRVCGIHKRSMAAWYINATFQPIEPE